MKLRRLTGTRFLTYNDAVGKKQKVDIRGKTTQHEASGHHEATEDRHGSGSKRRDTEAADGT